MATEVVQQWTNVTPSEAPPDYYLPTVNGRNIPAGKTRWRLNVDQSNVPEGEHYGLHVEYRVGGQWFHDAGSDDFVGGEIFLRSGGSTFINSLSSSIGSDDPDRVYPDRMRLHVTKLQPGRLFPSVTFTMT